MLFIFGNFQSGFSDGETASFPGIWLCFTLLSQEFWSTWPAVWWPHALHFDTGSDRTQSPSWMLPWISKSSGNKQNLLSTRRTGHCIVSSTDKGHQKRYFITTASGDLYLKKKKKFLIQFIGDIGTLSSVGIHFDLFQIVTRGGLFWVIRLTFPLVLEMRRLRLGGKIAQNYLTGGWQRHLGPCLLWSFWLTELLTYPVLMSSLLASTGLSPDRALWERHFGVQQISIPQGKVSYQPPLEVPSACGWDQVGGQQPYGTQAHLGSQGRPDVYGKCSEISHSHLLKTFSLPGTGMKQHHTWILHSLEYSFLIILLLYSPGKFQPLLLFHLNNNV